jgi:hypothetical protein
MRGARAAAPAVGGNAGGIGEQGGWGAGASGVKPSLCAGRVSLCPFSCASL